ncbi:MAG: MoaD/ThiS family protein [Phycisphaerae bacterium]|nr:MoaD/ThiS family protein [Phycisphaerae bacterium]
MLRMTTGVSSVEVETDGPITMRQLIDLACQKTRPQLKGDLLEGPQIKKGTLLLVDGRNVLFLDGLDTMVQGDQVIAFFPPGGGG